MMYGVGVMVLLWMAALSYFDIRFRRLPNWLTLPAATGVVGVAVLCRDMSTLVGAMALAGLYLVVHLVRPRALGAGDVKLAFSTGGVSGAFGLDVWFLAAIAAPLVTGLIGLVLLAWGRRNTSVPHGPPMCLSTVAVIVLGLSTASSL